MVRSHFDDKLLLFNPPKALHLTEGLHVVSFKSTAALQHTVHIYICTTKYKDIPTWWPVLQRKKKKKTWLTTYYYTVPTTIRLQKEAISTLITKGHSLRSALHFPLANKDLNYLPLCQRPSCCHMGVVMAVLMMIAGTSTCPLGSVGKVPVDVERPHWRSHSCIHHHMKDLILKDEHGLNWYLLTHWEWRPHYIYS